MKLKVIINKIVYLLSSFIEWLLKIKPEETSWFTSEKEEMELRDREIKMIEYQNKVEKSKIKNKRIKQLLSDIIGFYVRENKPSWTHFLNVEVNLMKN